MTKGKPSEYEINVIREIKEWKNPPKSWWNKVTSIVTYPLTVATETIQKIPGVEWVLKKVIGGIIELINDYTQWTISQEATASEYHNKGFDVDNSQDILKFDIKEPDEMIAWVSTKYKTMAGAEGAAAGLSGVYGIPVDILAILTLNLRAIGVYASYYGFDTSDQHERLFALNILRYASSPDDAAKQTTMAELVKVSGMIAKKQNWDQLNQKSIVIVIKKIAETVGIRLTKAKLAQIVPITGAIVGAGFNVYYTGKVCEAAYYLYRERFLSMKYGEEVHDQVFNKSQ